MNLRIVAVNKDGYTRVVLSLDEKQIRMTDARLKDTLVPVIGLELNPADFPEAERFVIEYQRS